MDDVIGVVDLMNGVAVRGIAGERSRYRPVEELWAGGNALIHWYRSIGVRQFYVADLDALMQQGRQDAALSSLAKELCDGETLWIDCGWRGSVSQSDRDWVAGIMSSISVESDVRWIVASESADSLAVLDQMLDLIAARKLTLSLDFRGGQFVGPETVWDWVQAAGERGIREAILLDVASVGSESGPRDCKVFAELVEQYRGLDWITGGGIRFPEEVQDLVNQGYSRVLVASALRPRSVMNAKPKTS